MIKIGIYVVLRGYIKTISGKRSYINVSGFIHYKFKFGADLPRPLFIYTSVSFSLVEFISRSDSVKRLAMSTTILV